MEQCVFTQVMLLSVCVFDLRLPCAKCSTTEPVFAWALPLPLPSSPSCF